MSNRQSTRTICFECHSRCGVFIEVEQGRIVGIRGDKDHPISRGFICPKARAVKEIVYHPERITKPLKRDGEKGQGQWVEISWDEALREIGSRLLRYKADNGAESVVFGQGTTRGIPMYINRFLSLFGSPNFMGTQNLSGFPVIAGSVNTCGFSFMGNADYKNTSCMLLWAQNPHGAFPGLLLSDINTGLKRGAKLIVIDPVFTRAASKAHIWLPIRPGTDLALALSWLNIISPLVLAKPSMIALLNPFLRPCCTTSMESLLFFALFSSISAVPSVEPPSTKTTSKLFLG